MAWMGIPKGSLSWQGVLHEYSISDIAVRGCCRDCGSTMTMNYHCYPDKTHVAVGTIVEGSESVPRVATHIFFKSKPVWYNIPDGVEKWDEFDPEFEKRLKDHKGEKAPN